MPSAGRTGERPLRELSDGRDTVERMCVQKKGEPVAGDAEGPPYAAAMGPSRLEQVALVALLQTRPDKLSWPEIVSEVIAAGSASAVWEQRAPADVLLSPPGAQTPLEAAEQAIEAWEKQDFTFLTVLDDAYPARLRGIHQAPPLLFARGDLVHDDRAVSVVGSREASPLGLKIAREVAEVLVADDVTVVAGLAVGIDTAAHRAALDAGGRTVAVIGSGINRVYPAANAHLHEEVAARGLLLSQFLPDAPPQKHTFLMRNATMSGYGLATVVVEAGEQSGARAQARMAVEHGRPVILTDLVVKRNTWAQALQGRPGVHVARNVSEVRAIVSEITADQRLLQEALRLTCA